MWGLRGHCPHHQAAGAGTAPLTLLQQEIDEYYHHFRLSNNLLELRNWCRWLTDGALCTTEKKSRGLHFIRDYPDLLPEAPAYRAATPVRT